MICSIELRKQNVVFDGRGIRTQKEVYYQKDGKDHGKHNQIDRDQPPEFSAQKLKITFQRGGGILLDRVVKAVTVGIEQLKEPIVFLVFQDASSSHKIFHIILAHFTEKVKENRRRKEK